MGYEANADFLYLKPERSGLDFAILPRVEGKDPLQDLELDWHSGYRVVLGNNFCNTWFLEGRFTHLCTKDCADASAESLIATRVPPTVLLTVVYDRAETTFRIRYDVGDFLLGAENCSCHPALSFRAFAGARFAFIEQEMTTIYRGLLVQDVIFVAPEEKQTIHGYGLLAGMHADYLCWCDLLHLYAKGSIGLMYSKFSGTAFGPTTDSSFPFVIDIAYDNNVQVPFFNLEVGLECWSMQCFGAQLAWGVGYLFENYCFEDFLTSLNGEDINRNQAMFGYHGLVVRGSVQF